MNDYVSLVNALNDMFYKEEYRSFPIDVVEGENSYIVTAEIPGVKKENIKITFEDSVMTITATKDYDKHAKYLIHERNGMKMSREIHFKDLKEESMTANYQDGILTVTITTVAPKPKKIIEIQ